MILFFEYTWLIGKTSKNSSFTRIFFYLFVNTLRRNKRQSWYNQIYLFNMVCFSNLINVFYILLMNNNFVSKFFFEYLYIIFFRFYTNYFSSWFGIFENIFRKYTCSCTEFYHRIYGRKINILDHLFCQKFWTWRDWCVLSTIFELITKEDYSFIHAIFFIKIKKIFY